MKRTLLILFVLPLFTVAQEKRDATDIDNNITIEPAQKSRTETPCRTPLQYLSLPAIYSDNMIIQRDKPFIVTGTANAGSKVTVKLDRKKIKTTADKEGKWRVIFSSMPADGKIHTMTIESGKEKITYSNIAVGEVWLCSGQSNMAFMVKESSHKEQSLTNTKGKDIRLYNMKPRVLTNNIEWDSIDLVKLNTHDYYLPTSWQMQNEENVSNFSAVAYHFGVMLADSLNIPIGLICNAIGGAPAEAYIDYKRLESHPVLAGLLHNWKDNEMIQEWCRERAKQNIAKSNDELQHHPYEPCYLFDTGIAPISCYSIKGVIWYQGESNAHNVELHEIIFPTLIECWRSTWNTPDMPFYFVQLSSINRPTWPHFRDSQRRMAEKIPHCDYAVSSDKGHPWDVHPKEKAPIGERLARLALNKTYGMKNIKSQGPTVVKAVIREKQTVIEFNNAETLMTSDENPLRGLEICRTKGEFTPVNESEMIIDGNCIIINDIAHIVRYGWKPYTDANLVNEEGLPASTFELYVE